MIEIVTFTGVDERTDLDELRYVASKYLFAEFGILVGSQTGDGNPIFPPLPLVYRLKDILLRDRIAIHLCGGYARQAMNHPGAGYGTMDWVYNVTQGFGRIQVNLHADVDTPELDLSNAPYISTFVNFSSADRIILQHRSDWDTVPLIHPKVEYLFDLSEGAGLEGFDQWPAPPVDGTRVGYAGGIGPHNIDRALEFADRYPDVPMWIDMERAVRTDDYWFDLDRVRAVCEKVKAAQKAGT